MSRPELSGLRLADGVAGWAELGFHVSGTAVWLDGVSIELGAAGEGIVGWRLDGIEPVGAIDGLDTSVGKAPSDEEPVPHPNGAVGLDHVVVMTPRFARTAAELAEAGLELRRIRQAPGGIRQGFRRLGPVILELVEAREERDGPARFWGLVVNVSDLDALAERLGDRLGEVRPAVQPRRRIATLRASAGLGEAVAFMSLEGG
ncbi:MAG TPA: hypothetical protein VMD09_17450 [Solirubrobacteraceae bacterium]|nr:hypothetical protein [Solirubrobacteraceae bacterium]